MNWVEGMSKAIDYIESNITEPITISDIARQAAVSPFYFQKGFAMLCGFTVGEYIRQRRLTLAGAEFVADDEKIIDVAIKYGYDSPDAFTKAFTRFHGATPTAVRKGGATLKTFAALKIKFSLEGGYIMDYKIEQKPAFTVIGAKKTFKYENAKTEIPKLWTQFFKDGGGKTVCGEYGISIDESMGSEEFEYLIADTYKAGAPVPEGFVTCEIPAFTWAVFPCKGAMPQSLQSTNSRIFSEWLPSCEYEFAAGYFVELYSNPTDYPNGTNDENYYSELWMPVKKKQ